MVHIIDLPYDMIDCISDYLSFVDKQNMKYSCKTFNIGIKNKLSEFEQLLFNKINDILTPNIGHNLFKLIKDSNGQIQIGGNFIAQILANQTFSNHNINIYVNYDYDPINKIIEEADDSWSEKLYHVLVENIFYSLGIDNNSSNRVSVYFIDYNQIYEENIGDADMRGVRGPRGVRGQHPPKPPKLFNIILVPVLYNTPKNILRDFSFCYNKYDGKNVYSYLKKDIISYAANLKKSPYNFIEPHIWKNDIVCCSKYNNVLFKKVSLTHNNMTRAIRKTIDYPNNNAHINNKFLSLKQYTAPTHTTQCKSFYSKTHLWFKNFGDHLLNLIFIWLLTFLIFIWLISFINLFINN